MKQTEKQKANLRKYYHSDKGKLSRKRERAKRVEKLYNMTEKQYNRMFVRQNGVCKICGEPEINRHLAVDHNHKTGKIRGLLCWKCNMCLGIFEKRFDDFTKYLGI